MTMGTEEMGQDHHLHLSLYFSVNSFSNNCCIHCSCSPSPNQPPSCSTKVHQGHSAVSAACLGSECLLPAGHYRNTSPGRHPGGTPWPDAWACVCLTATSSGSAVTSSLSSRAQPAFGGRVILAIFVFANLFFQICLTAHESRACARVGPQQHKVLHCISCGLIYVSSGHSRNISASRHTLISCGFWGFFLFFVFFCSNCFEIKQSLPWTAVDTGLFRMFGE